MALEYHSLDDQSYESIIEQAKSRLPWLCPAWTDHNAHDPGITVLELMAWYKELQQYYMDQMTPAVQRALLKLAGIVPEGPRAASCMVEAAPDGPPRLAGTRLKSPQGIPFELTEPIPVLRTHLASMRIVQNGQEYNAEALISADASFYPFSFRSGGSGEGYTGQAAESFLRLGLAGKPVGELRLWFDVAQPEDSRRNPPDAFSLPPRTVVWEAENADMLAKNGGGNPVPLEVLRDDTWVLSWSGYVTLSAPATWKAGRDGLYWLTVRQTSAGCEEEVRLSGVSSNRFLCVQRESRVKRYGFRMPSAPGQEVLIPDAQAKYADLAVFRRTAGGWEQAEQTENAVLSEGRLIRLNTEACLQDGEENLMVVSQDTMRPLLYDLRGLPGERLFLDLGGKTVLDLELLCQTLEPDGTVRPDLWRRVDTLSVCGPRDRAFVWDAAREEIIFGDGLRGAVPEAGEGAAMVSSLILSECGRGNLPAGSGLVCAEDGTRLENGAASGGQDAETLAEAGNRLLRKMEDTGKCQSAQDFARCALRTPGVRLAGAKALPGYDPAMGTGRRHAGYVSVVLLPASEAVRPAPDSRLLAAADRQLERFRSVCVQAKAAAPRYLPLSVFLHALVLPGTRRETLEAVIREWLRPRTERIGQTIRNNDAMTLLQKTDGVLQVYRAELRPLGAGGYLTPAGDLRLPPDGLPALETVEIELTEI